MQVAVKYGDSAPLTAVCCNACRTCATTNVLALGTGAALAAVYGVARLGKKLVRAT